MGCALYETLGLDCNDEEHHCADCPSHEEFRIDIVPGPFNVKGHTAAFTGAFWFIVTEGEFTSPIDCDGVSYFDDWNDAQHYANKFNEEGRNDDDS